MFEKIEAWLDKAILTIARHGRVECYKCGTFNKKGYVCYCSKKPYSSDE